MSREEEEEEDIVCLDESFFIDDNYQITDFTFGSHVLQLYCLQSASTDFDLTGQLVWPGAELLNDYLTKNANMLQGCSVIELGSGVGITGVLCSRFCREVVMTDHNEEVLKILNKNIKLQESLDDSICCAELKAEKLEWGNSAQLNHILQQHPEGFDLVLGADICFQQANIPLLFDTVEQLFRDRDQSKCKFVLGYVSRTKVMDAMVINEAIRHGLQINEVSGTRRSIRNHEGVIFEITTNH
ncbi:PREDICTED: protein N-lysine methyltransferase METTL21A [Nicotiana attenuata]|uniref:protein N-lysine methyltransferase METTL21A n=1 Tax=Nicotiana attenuata TaxID=49451 RepID=UPI000905C9C9|nr:PREDICTED: protein N-lysine methyltransferase METTL21A [Nicotiana attenuata]